MFREGIGAYGVPFRSLILFRLRRLLSLVLLRLLVLRTALGECDGRNGQRKCEQS
jgi:hypothetical protein